MLHCLSATRSESLTFTSRTLLQLERPFLSCASFMEALGDRKFFRLSPIIITQTPPQ